MVDTRQLRHTAHKRTDNQRVLKLHLGITSVISCCLALATPVRTAAADTGFYRCEIEGQPVLFSQFVCPADRSQQLLTPGEHNTVAIPALSAEETAALASLERSLRATRVEQRRNQRRQQQLHRRNLQQAADLCDAARLGLEAIRKRKRQGYSAAQAQKLTIEQQRLQAQKKANC